MYMYYTLYSYDKVSERDENVKKVIRKRKYTYDTELYLSILYTYVTCLQDELSVSTYANIVIYDTKRCRCYMYY